ncbi:MAG TPA: non-homologous end-joining DNA ligase [Acidimicrobiales bacterium]|nr:non-homologous end-joining DNA ligase [Acidimicrobiales bacterium]
MSPDSQRVMVDVGGRELQLSNLEKPLYPTGFTKGDLLDYYARIAPVMLRHLRDRPVTVKRFPEGVEQQGFIAKNVPRHAPDWLRTVTLPRKGTDRWGKPSGSENDRETTQFVVVEDLATLMWLVNLAAVEFHTPMWRIGQKGQPRSPDLLVLDLDPGHPATITECCQIALSLRDRVSKDGIELIPKTSGSKGVQLYARIAARRWSADRVNDYARELAEELERTLPDLAVSRMAKALRPGKVLIDWSQNNMAKTTVSPYSLRALERPTVSTPLSWDEVGRGADGDGGADGPGAGLLAFGPRDVLARVETLGDLFESLGS